jgi:hypothetical protein
MAEESTPSESGGVPPSAAAAFAALAYASRDKADAFLDEQTRLAREQAAVARLQAEDLRREDSLRHWSLRVRHISDVVKVMFEVALAVVVLGVVIGAAAVLWTAAHDDSLVIEAFGVPPDLAARGLTGQAIAAQLQDQLAAMQDATDSSRPAKSYANNWDDGIKVIIPDTGISVGDLYRTLAGWLGHQTRITGEVYRTPTGIAITARSNGAGGFTVAGSENAFAALLQQSAEAIYHRTQPYRYAVYLASTGQMPRALPIYRALADNGDREDRIWAHMGISGAYEFSAPFAAPVENRKALAIDPDFILAYQNLASEEAVLGHPEPALAALRKSLSLYESIGGQMSERARAISVPSGRGNLAHLLGDCQGAIGQYAASAALPDYASIAEYDRMQIASCRAQLHEPAAAREAWANIPVPDTMSLDVTFYYPIKIESDAAAQDWTAVLADRAAAEAGYGALVARIPPIKPGFDTQLSRQIWPFAALALAEGGDIAGARRSIAATPLDCYLCLRMRGRIEALARNWRGAGYWFARAVRFAPSIPFAYGEWGGMLLAKGDTAGAIAQLSAAHDKAPHYADPLEMWGEALIASNRSDLALAKFAEAADDAPDWGRLHLKWGEALWWSGDRDGARRQFAIAETLCLTPRERARLAAF